MPTNLIPLALKPCNCHWSQPVGKVHGLATVGEMTVGPHHTTTCPRWRDHCTGEG